MTSFNKLLKLGESRSNFGVLRKGLVLKTEIEAIWVFCLLVAVSCFSHDQCLATHCSASSRLSRPDRQTLREDFWGVGGLAPRISVFNLKNLEYQNEKLECWLSAFKICKLPDLQRGTSQEFDSVLFSWTHHVVMR
jgi:hypothetical protein